MDAAKLQNQTKLRKFGQQQFSSNLTSKDGWIFKGDGLQIAALELCRSLRRADEALQAKIDAGQSSFPPEDYEAMRISTCQDTIMLLLGFSIENYLKGVWVHLNPSLEEDARMLPPQFRDRTAHDLVAQATYLGLDLDAEENKVLTTLTEFVLWRGRYPVALNAVLTGEAMARGGSFFTVINAAPDPIGWTPAILGVLDKIRALHSPVNDDDRAGQG
jgi:hypothetical protein